MIMLVKYFIPGLAQVILLISPFAMQVDSKMVVEVKQNGWYFAFPEE